MKHVEDIDYVMAISVWVKPLMLRRDMVADHLPYLEVVTISKGTSSPSEDSATL